MKSIFPATLNEKHWFAKYALLFLIVFSVSYYLFVTNFDLLLPYFAFLARLVHAVIGLFYDGIVRDGNVLVHRNFGLEITRGCDGVTSLILILAAVIPFPTNMRAKLIALLIAVPTIFVFNYLRILALILSKLHFPSWFDVMHTHILQPIMALITFGVFAVWLIIYGKPTR